MMKRRNLILITVLLMLASVFLTACKIGDNTEGQNATINKEQTDSEKETVSDEPIEYNADYAEDDEITNEDSSGEILDEHEEETVIGESGDIGTIQEEGSEY